MTSKEAFSKIAEKYGETNSLEGTYNYFLTIKEDLDILEEIRNTFKVIDYGEEYQNRYALQAGDVIYPINKITYDIWNRWLNYDK